MICMMSRVEAGPPEQLTGGQNPLVFTLVVGSIKQGIVVARRVTKLTY